MRHIAIPSTHDIRQAWEHDGHDSALFDAWLTDVESAAYRDGLRDGADDDDHRPSD